MSFIDQPAAQPSSIPYINDNYLADEQTIVRELAAKADPGEATRRKIVDTAAQLVRAVRKNTKNDGGIEAFLKTYDLSSDEGVLLMCIAEALLRIPDADTADRLIADKITAARWQDHVGTSDSLFVNASTWGLMLTGKILTMDEIGTGNPTRMLGKLVSRAGEPVVRTAMRQAMKIMGHQFVMGRNIGEALKRAMKSTDLPYRYSFDMLGESALTAADAQRYLDNYHEGIKSIAEGPQVESADVFSAPGISVKLSALHPRYEYSHEERVMAELVPACEGSRYRPDDRLGRSASTRNVARHIRTCLSRSGSRWLGRLRCRAADLPAAWQRCHAVPGRPGRGCWSAHTGTSCKRRVLG
jgi:RHH-type proline utilization regulon transcriptional repressor/proline dehydrogenase/delta 1-pyrroline-5-carboxylate dehydrogenase